MAGKITIRDNSGEVLEALELAKHRGLEAIGLTAEGHAKKTITAAGAVDTGRLRNSITYAIAGYPTHVESYKGKGDSTANTYSGGAMEGEKDSAVFIGTNVEYAPYVENGARGRKPVHFLQSAASGHGEEYKRLMEDSMKNA